VVTQLLDFDHPSAEDMEPAIRLTRCVTTQGCHIIPFSLNDFDAEDSNARVRFLFRGACLFFRWMSINHLLGKRNLHLDRLAGFCWGFLGIASRERYQQPHKRSYTKCLPSPVVWET
jgi:hypothetical protein